MGRLAGHSLPSPSRSWSGPPDEPTLALPFRSGRVVPNEHLRFAVKQVKPATTRTCEVVSRLPVWQEGDAPVNLLTVWGDPSNRSSFTIDLFPLSDRFSHMAVRQVLVYAHDYLEAVEIARREAMRFELEPRSGDMQRLN